MLSSRPISISFFLVSYSLIFKYTFSISSVFYFVWIRIEVCKGKIRWERFHREQNNLGMITPFSFKSNYFNLLWVMLTAIRTIKNCKLVALMINFWVYEAHDDVHLFHFVASNLSNLLSDFLEGSILKVFNP